MLSRFQLWKIETKIIDTLRITLAGKSWNIHDQSANTNLLDTLPDLWLRFNVTLRTEKKESISEFEIHLIKKRTKYIMTCLIFCYKNLESFHNFYLYSLKFNFFYFYHRFENNNFVNWTIIFIHFLIKKINE